MVNAISWNKIDTNLIPWNIKLGEYIFGVWPGTYSGWIVNINLLPVHYKWTSSISPVGSNNKLSTAIGGCATYSGSIWFFGYIKTYWPSANSQALFMLELNLTTGVVTERINRDVVDIWNGYSRVIESNVVYMNEVNGNRNHSFDLTNPVAWRTAWTAGQHGTGSTPTNSETSGGLTFQTLQYGLPNNQDTHTNIWHTWFYIS